MHSEELVNFFYGMAFIESLHRQNATTFEFSRRSIASHSSSICNHNAKINKWKT
jgi:hypothetical protein